MLHANPGTPRTQRHTITRICRRLPFIVRDGRGRDMMMAMMVIRPTGELAGVPDPAWPEWLGMVRLAPASRQGVLLGA